jgi:hypothetical protein
LINNQNGVVAFCVCNISLTHIIVQMIIHTLLYSSNISFSYELVSCKVNLNMLYSFIGFLVYLAVSLQPLCPD